MFAKSWMVSGRITELLFHERLLISQGVLQPVQGGDYEDIFPDFIHKTV